MYAPMCTAFVLIGNAATLLSDMSLAIGRKCVYSYVFPYNFTELRMPVSRWLCVNVKKRFAYDIFIFTVNALF